MRPEFLNESTFALAQISDGIRFLGTSFLAPLFSKNHPDSQYLVTAYHCVSEALARGHSIVVLADGGSRIIATYEFGSDRSAEGDDFAVLRLDQHIDGESLPCTIVPPFGPVFVRGVASGLNTQFANLHGQLMGIETSRTTTLPVLDMTFVHVPAGLFVTAAYRGQSTTPHDVWRGLSGAPILCCSGDYQTIRAVVGVFTKLAPGGHGARTYGTPWGRVREACRRHGLDVQSTALEPHEIGDNSIVLATVLQDIETPEGERRAWDILSNLLFQGYPADAWLDEVIRSPLNYGVDTSCEAILHFLKARLLMKRGFVHIGLRSFDMALVLCAQLPERVRARLVALIQSRNSLARVRTHSWRERMSRTVQSRERIKALVGVPDEYIAYESASLIGQELVELSFSETDMAQDEVGSYFNLALDEHTQLFHRYPAELGKQDVVNTALTIVALLWCSRHSSDLPGELRQWAALGVKQARIRHNSIFFLQMLTVVAIVELLAGANTDPRRLIALFVYVGQAMRAGGLAITHEGLSQLFAYLERLAPGCRRLIQTSIECTSLLDGRRLYDLSPIRISKSDIRSSLAAVATWNAALPPFSKLYRASLDDFTL